MFHAYDSAFFLTEILLCDVDSLLLTRSCLLSFGNCVLHRIDGHRAAARHTNSSLLCIICGDHIGKLRQDAPSLLHSNTTL